MAMTILYQINILIDKWLSNRCVSPKLLTSVEISNLFEENIKSLNV